MFALPLFNFLNAYLSLNNLLFLESSSFTAFYEYQIEHFYIIKKAIIITHIIFCVTFPFVANTAAKNVSIST